jgi:hypothetical protein
VSATAKELPPGGARHRRPISAFTQCFGITEAEVVRIEREGLDNNWPMAALCSWRWCFSCSADGFSCFEVGIGPLA